MNTGDAMTNDRIHIGSSYYPEHWEERYWANDIRLMKEAGFLAKTN